MLNLDSDIRRKPAFDSRTLIEIGFVDDVIVDPAFGILAVVVHGARGGTWAFPYAHVQFLQDGITVAGHGRQSPRRFLREGRSYQDLIGGEVLAPDGSVAGRIQDIELANLATGEIAYRVSPAGMRSLWTGVATVRAPAVVLGEDPNAIVIRKGEDLYVINEARRCDEVREDRSEHEVAAARLAGPLDRQLLP